VCVCVCVCVCVYVCVCSGVLNVSQNKVWQKSEQVASLFVQGNNEKWKETLQTHCYSLILSTVYFDDDFFLLTDINKVRFWLSFLSFRSQDIVFSIMTGLGAGWSRVWFPPWAARNISVLQHCWDWLWSPLLLLLKWYNGVSS
jgi:hypothetical protein